MYNKEDIQVNYLVYESALARVDRVNKRLLTLCVVIFLAFILSNMAWIVFENKYTDNVTTIEAEQDGEGINLIGGGSVNYGAEGKNNN